MGKVRIKSFGEEGLEEKNTKKEVKKAEKKLKKEAVAEEPQIEAVEIEVSESPTEEIKAEPKKEKKTKTSGTKKGKIRSKTYQNVVSLVDKNKTYSLKEALELLPKLKRADFDETVELHITTTTTGNLGQVTLPHGNGKEIKVEIVTDKLIAEIEKGKIDFDILLATPDMMPKLARVAKFLGPKGLMPNPKTGTVVPNPEQAAEKFKKGQINVKTEAKSPLIHLSIGKVSYNEKQLGENIEAILDVLKGKEVKKVVLKSTMSPAIKIATN